MRTVPSLCASGVGISVSAIGLAIARPEQLHHHSSTHTPAPEPEMTAVATYAVTSNLATPFAFSTPHQPRRIASDRQDGNPRSSSGARLIQTSSPAPRARSSAGMDRSQRRDGETESQSDTPDSQSYKWLRRLSSGMSTSRDSSRQRTPTSRPGSAAVSHSNGSLAISHTSSTTPMFPTNTTPTTAPNKLVKRTSSVRSMSDSPFRSSPGSRLPLPVLRRPATSHQRNATLQDTSSMTKQTDRMSLDGDSPLPRDVQWRNYFTPRVATDDVSVVKNRTSSGIPNPIKRVYPDRKYTPTLVSAKELVNPALLELDDGMSEPEDEVAVTKLEMAPKVASSPYTLQTVHLEENRGPRRSFSIGDLLSTGPQPLWRRPPSAKNRQPSARLQRKTRSRVASESVVGMGTNGSNDSGRPAKRRDLTDPEAYKRSIYSSSGRHSADIYHGRIETTAPTNSTPDDNSRHSRSMLTANTSSPLEHQRLPSGVSDSPAVRTVRVSATHSEITSTVGSDSENRSVGDYSTDYQSDAVWDSFPTRTTRSSSGRRGPHIETLFDESPPSFSSGQSTKLRDFLSNGEIPNGNHSARYRHSTIEEEESVLSTPVRSLRNQSVASTPSARPTSHQVISSSPPLMDINADPEDIDWDAQEDDVPNHGLGLNHQSTSSRVNEQWTEQGLPVRLGTMLRTDPSHPTDPKVRDNAPSLLERTNLFDWSEQQSSPSHTTDSPPRPRTVHGKKDQDGRGSRPSGRRPPSGMHARSHSVPVVPDADGKRNNLVTNKFGTWGVGSKAVTEDWNDDFDFDNPTPPIPTDTGHDEKRIDSGHEMFVPRSIRERQENVVANIGLLREWGLLIEELKDLRVRAVALDMLSGPYAQVWREVDAMIELADQETEEGTLEPRRSPPSSPGFDYSAFEEPQSAMVTPTGSHHTPVRLPDPALSASEVTQGATGETLLYSTPSAGRPRKDSELVAQTVIAALQAKRSGASEPSSSLHTGSTSKKVPFDTATLRHIVPYVNGLKRRVKEALRETEGLNPSPRRRGSTSRFRDHSSPPSGEPSFHRIFQEDDATRRRRTRRDEAATDHDGNETPVE